MQESQSQREERKNMYISYVLARAREAIDYEALIEEAVQKWELGNPYQKKMSKR